MIAGSGRATRYLVDEHTLAHFRGEFYFSPLANRLNAPTWEAAGARRRAGAGRGGVRDILARRAGLPVGGAVARGAGALVKAEESLANLEMRV